MPYGSPRAYCWSRVLVGCGKQDAPTAANGLPAPSFNFINGPESPGESGVFRGPIRFAGGFFLVSNDLDRNQPVVTLVVRHYQSDDVFFCNGSEDFPTRDLQRITDPQDVVDAIVFLTQAGELPVLIYPPFPGGNLAVFCAFLKNDWLYRGTHNVRTQDNNFFGDPSRTNSFGFTGNGFVYDLSGNKYRYTEAQRDVNATDPFAMLNNQAQINIVPVDGP